VLFIKSYFIIGKVYPQGIPGVTTMLKTKLIETGVQDSRSRETRQAHKRQGWTAREKRVPADGNGKHKKNCKQLHNYRVSSQSEGWDIIPP